MARIGESGDLLKCSFCGKSQKQVKKLIAGPGVYICDECIDLCNEIIEEELSESTEVSCDELPKPREIYDFLGEYVIGQDVAEEGARRRRLQPLQAAACRRDRSQERRQRRASQVEHLAAWPDGLRQDAAGADARADAQCPVRDCRRHCTHRSWLRRRRCREHSCSS